jgi:hypothetical protein
LTGIYEIRIEFVKKIVRSMTNYEELFKEQMQSKGFAKAYYESRIGRIVDEFLDTLKEKLMCLLKK